MKSASLCYQHCGMWENIILISAESLFLSATSIHVGILNTIFQPVYKLYRKLFGKYVDALNEAYPYPVKVFRIGFRCLGVMVAFLFVLYILILFGVFGIVPTRSEIKEINNYTASEIYSQDSVLLGKYFIQNRTNAKYEDLPQYLIDALVATEDSRFYEHKGVDFMSFTRVLILSIILNDDAGGGSTITQQLAKNLYGRKDYGPLTMPVNKFREVIIAGRLENVYSKQEILELYFNTVPFGEDCYGIEASALRFFSTTPKHLTIEQSAVLVGLLKANTTYNPRVYPDRSLARRNVVINQMVTYHYLSDTVADSIKQLDLELNYRRESQSEGPAPYFREYLRQELETWVEEHPKEDGSKWNIYTDGLKIYTTINGKLQQYAEEAMKEQMESLQKQFERHWGKTPPWGKNEKVVTAAMKRSDRYNQLKELGYSDKGISKRFGDTVQTTVFSWDGPKDTMMTPLDSVKYHVKLLQTGFMAMEPKTGYIIAWVGGTDHTFFKYDHVLAKRQVGSTFKPIVYAAAIESGIDPCTYIPNQKKIYDTKDSWSPSNSDGNYGGYYSLQGGLTHSVNTIAAELIMRTGVDNVISLSQKMGIRSKLPKVPSIALGTASISLYEMVTAYGCFANRGLRVDPNFLLRIETAKGDTLFVSENAKKTRVMSQETADLMIQIMRSVVNNGTASRLRGTYGLAMDLAGKTGTTQDNTDGWFIGYNSRIVAGAWVGAEDPAIRWKSTALGQGAATALPVFGKFMNKSLRDANTRKLVSGGFNTPPDSIMAELNCAMWIPDSINYDSIGFVPGVVSKIREFLKTKGKDSLLQDYPGAEK